MAVGFRYLRLSLFFICRHVGSAFSDGDRENSALACTKDAGCGEAHVLGENEDPESASDEGLDVRLLQKQLNVRRPRTASPASSHSSEGGLAQDPAGDESSILSQYDPLELCTKAVETVNSSLVQAMLQIEMGANKSVKLLSGVENMAGLFSSMFKEHAEEAKSLIESLKKMISDYVGKADALIVQSQSRASDLVEKATSLHDTLVQQITNIEEGILNARKNNGTSASLVQSGAASELFFNPFKWVQHIWNRMFGKAEASLPDKISNAEDYLSKVDEYLKTLEATIDDLVNKLFDGMTENVQSLASRANDLIGGSSLPKRLSSSATRALASLQEGVANQASTTIAQLKKLITATVAQAQKMKDALATHLKALREDAIVSADAEWEQKS